MAGSTLANRIAFIAASAGTGPFVFGSGVTSFLTLAQGVALGEIGNGALVSYIAQDSTSSPTQAEWGQGTFSSAGSGLIVRTTVYGTNNNGTIGSRSPLAFSVPPTILLTVLSQDVRQILSANTNYYVTTTGSDSNPGTSGSPWATLQHASDFVTNNLDMSSFVAQINIAAGVFAGVAASGMLGGGGVYFLGAGVASTTVTQGGTVFSIVNTLSRGYYEIDQLTCVMGNGGTGIGVTSGITFIDNVNFQLPAGGGATCISASTDATAEVFTDGGTAQTVNGTGAGANNIIWSVTFGAAFDGGTWTMTGTPQFNPAVLVDGAASFTENNTVAPYAGAATGQRFQVIGGGRIFGDSPVTGSPQSAILGPNFFPGNAAGTCDAASSYDGFQGPIPNPNEQTGASYTIAVTDLLSRIEMNNAGANTVTIPLDSALVSGGITRAEVHVTQAGAGATTVAAAAGVTVHNAGAVGGQWKTALVYWRAANEWVQTNA